METLYKDTIEVLRNTQVSDSGGSGTESEVIDSTIKGITTKITESISNILFSIPIFMLHLFILLFVMFFLFRDGKVFVDKIERLMPLKD